MLFRIKRKRKTKLTSAGATKAPLNEPGLRD
jgi:hypothetical protein